MRGLGPSGPWDNACSDRRGRCKGRLGLCPSHRVGRQAPQCGPAQCRAWRAEERGASGRHLALGSRGHGCGSCQLSRPAPSTHEAVEGWRSQGFGFDGEMGVEARGGGRGVSEIRLHEPTIDPSLQQLGRPAVAQRVNRRLCGEGALVEGFPERALHTALGHGCGGGRSADPPTTGRRADQDWMAMRDPRLATQWPRTMWPGNITIFPTFTTPDVDKPARTSKRWDLQRGALLQAQTTGVDRGEADAVAGASDTAEPPSNLFEAEDHRQLLLAWCSNNAEGGPGSVEGRLEAELDAAPRDRARTAGVIFDILAGEDVLSTCCLGEAVWRFAIVLR